MQIALEDNNLEAGNDCNKDKEDTGKELAEVPGKHLEKDNLALKEMGSVEDMMDSMEPTGWDCKEDTAAMENSHEVEHLEYLHY